MRISWILHDYNKRLLFVECGSVVNNTLTSPGYPNSYPNDLHCDYWVPIPEGMTLVITFENVDLAYDSSCR